MGLSWCWVQAKAARETQKTTVPALGKPHRVTM